jgi:hypothetical protein
MRVNVLPVVEGGKVVGGSRHGKVRQRARRKDRGGMEDTTSSQGGYAEEKASEEVDD